MTPLKAFVQLAYGFGGASWRKRWEDGKILGINEPQAYGYDRAAGPDVSVVYSEDAPESRLARLRRYLVRGVLGFDLVHVWRNRHGLLAADVVWTHAESQTLGVLLALRLLRPARPPRVIGQVVWLVERWRRQPWPRRLFFRWLLRRLDVLTVLSALNLADARALFPFLRAEQTIFGIRADEMRAPAPRAEAVPLRLVALGNDEHRDWPVLAAAMTRLPEAELRVASRSREASRAFHEAPRARLVSARDNGALMELYDSSDIVVVPLQPNRHASGITVIEEAFLRGIAVVATDVGGLRDYFDDQAVRYVPPGDPAALAEAIEALAADAGLRREMALAGQQRIRDAVNSAAYALRHVALSREVLADDAGTPLTDHPRVAIGIATSGRPEVLAALIGDLGRQTMRPDTVVISHATPGDIAGIAAPQNWPEGVLRFLTGRLGLTAQRNAILDSIANEADIVLFLDDDFFLAPTYIEEMIAAFRSDSRIVGVTGRVLEDGAKGPGLTAEYALEWLRRPADAPADAVIEAFNTYGCNMAFRLDAIRAAGLRFDERLPLYGWYEDMDFSRALRDRSRGRIIRAMRAEGVHLGSKRGKTSGLRLGYSQVVNPIYLAAKGTYPWDHALRSAGRHLLINTVRSVNPEPYADRRGRARGNLLGLLDLLRRRVAPERVLTLTSGR
ncbi:glycosyltransferase [Acidomonas methanolica]|uniref:Glycosyl transferase group 1 n=1 Tax=Acidomonas methanolica NBRC 104435 TaxID=1231351 RepID=A0A023D8T2_ACIMT|nr:glycosyltransferase [Acidomonas methanolica]TCS23477.1 GT2 family glycosyltransferase [Acidomonas methanolica]GAJ30538.1 glycosyl transferase group 1 [Acidomonas methanolica NBRC 104435]GBQ51710.1 hypothetical protein AA0498_1552 [Acidomonas methanolica]GEL00279.1 hypothetical protein AME01nite_27770 [Acidomonas methanolica NBRC 104435]